jgi:hypothetical protein
MKTEVVPIQYNLLLQMLLAAFYTKYFTVILIFFNPPIIFFSAESTASVLWLSNQIYPLRHRTEWL